ncbi:AMP-binding protein [Pseudonocardia halophobica]|uniref:AMP-binding protein n=1 Tax=Pseudonocardia halophobica TaxID=29401 RepID=UPI003D90A33A
MTARTLGDLLAAHPHDTAWTVAGERTSPAALDAAANRLAAGFLALDHEPGDHVALMMRASPAALAVWFGLARAGLVEVPLTTATRGHLLEHLLAHSRARTVVCDAEFLPLVREAAPANVRVVVHGPGDAPTLADVEREPAGFPAVDPDATTVVLYTSGTTGPPKGVRLSHRSNLWLARRTVELMGYTAADRLYSVFPLFHSNARFCSVLPALLTGAGLVMDRRFSASGFWDTCRAHGVTAFNFQGAMLTLLHNRPPRPDDADNPVRVGFGAPCPPEVTEAFERRFDVALTEIYGSTEASLVVEGPPGERRSGSPGRAAAGYEVRIVDGRGHEVPRGEAGEIVCRPKVPGILFSGYHDMPDETVAAWRDLWFHTGDRGRMDADGYLYFLDRLSDSIRRRGENVSSWEIERVLATHPAVDAVAAYGVPSPLSEEDVMVAVVLVPGAELDGPGVVAHCTGRLTEFAVPRYVRFLDALPVTPSQRTEKYKLRADGVTADTWDREA